jgi:hypothetical protein
MTCAGPARSSAANPVETLSRFSSCWPRLHPGHRAPPWGRRSFDCHSFRALQFPSLRPRPAHNGPEIAKPSFTRLQLCNFGATRRKFMQRDIVMAALSVLNSCITNESPNRDEVATLAAQPENIGNTAPDDMARSVIEKYLNEKR